MCGGRRQARGGGCGCGYTRGRWVSVWTGRAQRAVAFTVGLANRDIAGETEAEAFADEGSEGEIIEAWVARGFGGEDARGGAVYVGCHGLTK